MPAMAATTADATLPKLDARAVHERRRARAKLTSPNKFALRNINGANAACPKKPQTREKPASSWRGFGGKRVMLDFEVASDRDILFAT